MNARVRRVGLYAALFAALPLAAPHLDEAQADPGGRPPIYVTFLWHMHQPVYYPYEPPTQTQQRGVYSFDVFGVHSQRAGAYTSWPADAVQSAMARGLPHAGAQVSFSGSLIGNLDDYEASGWGFSGWKNRWRESAGWRTALGNPRLDLVGFGYHHPLLPLLDDEVARRQIDAHKQAYARAWQRPMSKGFFPPENAFASWMVPALTAEGYEWVVADNIHLQRACQGYPWSPGGNLIPPNRADQLNPDPGDWTQLNGVWAPTKVSAGWSFRPHWVRHVDPQSGRERRMIVVPTARYMGNEDGRGGFGALQYDQVMSQLAGANADPDHPILIVLHHDGDNYGGGSDSYYHANWQRFLDWATANGQRFVPTTIQDYLQMFPPAQDDVVHVEPGSWSGADNGDAEFKKWLGDPDPQTGYSPDINSWAVMVAAANRVKTAGSLDPSGAEQAEAWRLLLNGFASDYWYWDGTEIWDSNPTRAANGATWHADRVLAQGGPDVVPPQVFLPQREPYNPGAREWKQTPEPSDFTVWTLAYDTSGLARMTLRYRLDADGTNPLDDDENETLAGGPGVGPWQELPMQVDALPASHTNPAPSHRAERYAARLTGLAGHLVDYYVEAADAAGNVARSPLLHVWVGGQAAGPQVTPAKPGWADTITIHATQPGVLHWGVDGFQTPPASSQSAGTTATAGGAVETPLLPDGQGGYAAQIGPFRTARDVHRVDYVIRRPDGSWDNAGGQDYHVALQTKQVWWDAPRLGSGPLRVFTTRPGVVHAGRDGWQGLQDVPLVGPDPAGVYEAALPVPAAASSLEFALRWADGSWDNNGGRDFRVSR